MSLKSILFLFFTCYFLINSALSAEINEKDVNSIDDEELEPLKQDENGEEGEEVQNPESEQSPEQEPEEEIHYDQTQQEPAEKKVKKPIKPQGKKKIKNKKTREYLEEDEEPDKIENQDFKKVFNRKLLLKPKSTSTAVSLSLFVGFGAGNFYADDYYHGYLQLCTQFLALGLTIFGFSMAYSDPQTLFTDPYLSPGELFFYSGLTLFLGMRAWDIANAVFATDAYNEKNKMKLRRMSDEISLYPIYIDKKLYLATSIRF